MIGSLKRKCAGCSNKVKRADAYKLNMKMSDGVKSVYLCENCASRLLIEEKRLEQSLGSSKQPE